MKFEWEPSKAATNLKKHRVSFAEAQTVFENPLAFNSARLATRKEREDYEQNTF